MKGNALPKVRALLVGMEQQAKQQQNRLLHTMGALAESQVRARLVEEKQDPTGNLWPALNPNYAKRKKKRSGSGLLEHQGHLVDSMESQIHDDSVEIGTNLVHTATHDQGDPKRNIPQRQFLGLSEEGAEAIQEEIV